jgi:long-chain fatty acid transport protein
MSAHTKTIRRRLIAATLVFLFAVAESPEKVLAAGFYLYEIGTPDVGLASAGYASRAQDASTLFTNPAGMTRLDGSQFLVGIQPVYFYQVFSPNGRTTKTGTDGGNSFVPLPTGSFFYVYSLTPKLKLGIGNVTYFGGAGVQPELGRQVLSSRRDVCRK